MKKWFITLVLIGILAMSASFAQQKVSLGVQPWLGYGPWWVAEEKGYFEENGVDVKLINFTWDQDMSAGLASGNLDVQAAATNTLITLINQNIDVQGFLLMDASYEADAIMASKEIDSIKDLVGKKVAYELGSTSDLLLNYALGEAGYTISDVEAVPMGADAAGLSLITNRVDAAVTYEPYISAALREGNGQHVIYTAAEKPGLISDIMIARSEFIDNNPELILGLAKAWDQAVQFLRDNPEEGGKIIADAVGSPMDEFTVAFEGVKLYDFAQSNEQLGGAFADTFTTVAKIMMSQNPDEISFVPEFGKAVNLSYVQ